MFLSLLADLLALESRLETFLPLQFAPDNHKLVEKNRFLHGVILLPQQQALLFPRKKPIRCLRLVLPADQFRYLIPLVQLAVQHDASLFLIPSFFFFRYSSNPAYQLSAGTDRIYSGVLHLNSLIYFAQIMNTTTATHRLKMRESYFYRNRIKRTKPNDQRKKLIFFSLHPKASAETGKHGGPLKTIFEYQDFE